MSNHRLAKIRVLPCVTVSTPTALTPAALPAAAALFGYDQPRCDSVLGHIYSLAEDDQWHCQLREDHDGLCQAPDGTTW